jgi:hypothetical protein
LPAATPAIVKAKIKKADQVAAFFEATELAGFEREEALRFFGRPQALAARGAWRCWSRRRRNQAQGAFSEAVWRTDRMKARNPLSRMGRGVGVRDQPRIIETRRRRCVFCG